MTSAYNSRRKSLRRQPLPVNVGSAQPLNEVQAKRVSIQHLRDMAAHTDEVSRIAQTIELLDIYHHRWKPYLRDRLKAIFSPQGWEKIRLHQDTSLNLLRWAVDELACIYSEPAKRSIEGKDAQAIELYEQGGRLDATLDQAARLLFLCRNLFIRPFVRGKKIVLDLVTPDRVHVIPSRFDPEAIDAIAVKLPVMPWERLTASAPMWAFWTTEEFCYLTAGFTLYGEIKPNPYGVIPYLPCHASYPSSAFWQYYDSFGLREATYSAAMAMTDHAQLRHIQSFKQLVIAGTPEGKDWASMITDPTNAIHIKGDGRAEVLDMQADLPEHIDAILTSAAARLNMYGLRPDAVRGTLDASSGYALKIKERGKARVWGTQQRAWQLIEAQLYDLTCRVAEVDGMGAFSLPRGLLEVEHADLLQVDDPQAQAQERATLVTAQIISRAEARRAMGYDDEESAKIANEVLGEAVDLSSLAAMDGGGEL